MTEGKLLWVPDERRKTSANMTAYMSWLEESGRSLDSYRELWNWSVDDLNGFWESIWHYFGVDASPQYSEAIASRVMPGAKWFEGARLNYAEHVLRNRHDGPALICRDEKGRGESVSWTDLEARTASVAQWLVESGASAGDRVAGYLPNRSEAVVALLASASIGAIWSSCSPEFGAPSALDRFSQIEPKVLIAADGYEYGGKWFDRIEVLETISKSLPSLKKRVIVGGAERPVRAVKDFTSWEEIVTRGERPRYERVPFSSPLWILYSSGTTGLPKPIVQGQGGILLEHLKGLSLHNDVKRDDRFFWFTTTGWMMWNYLVGSLLCGATAVLYDGSPGHPSMDSLWDLAEDLGVTFMGASAPYVSSCMKARVEPSGTHRLSKLNGVGSTGAPLSPQAFEWLYRSVKEDLWVASVSGGTDVCTCFVGGCPTLPVYSGEIQCRWLGADVKAFDEEGRSVVGETGELVVASPMPSMPLFLWGDAEGRRYKESYFESFPGLWRHGDWIKITERGTCVIYGRSDATIKRLGVRIGTSELYRVVESMPEVADSLAIDVELSDGTSSMLLFVVVKGRKLDDALKGRIRERVRGDLSPRYVPDEILEAASIPKTISGKKLEVPIKRIFMGARPQDVLNPGSLADPAAVEGYVEAAKQFRKERKL